MGPLGLILAWTLLALPGGAEAGPDTLKPYEYRLILRIAPHRLFTRTFRNQLRAGLQDDIQAALGPLAQSEVVFAGDRPNDAWPDLRTLDSISDVGPGKRHFVEVTYADGRYDVRARQLDGATGLASPVVREGRTADPSFVSRLITGFVEEDFGPTGTIVAFDKANDRVELALQGGGIARTVLSRMVPAGSVFSISRIGGEPTRGHALESAYLVALAPPRDGRCECRFVYRFGDQLVERANGAYKAMKLGTGRGPVRLRLLDSGGLPATGLQVLVSAEGFRPDRVKDAGAVRDGNFESSHAYDGIAYALVTSGSQRVAQIPMPIVGDRVTTCRISTAPGGEARQRLELDVRNLQQRLVDIHRRLLAQHARLARLTESKNHAEALADVNRGLNRLDGELAALSSEIARLRHDTPASDPAITSTLDQSDIFVQEVRKQRDRLTQTQTALQEAIKTEQRQEPERDNVLALLRKADGERQDADFDGALKTYDEILKRFGDRLDVRKTRDDLERAWQVKNDQHRQARVFVYETWPNMRTVEDVERNLPKAREALAVCKQVGDRLTPLKLMSTFPTTAEIVGKAVDEIAKSETDTDKLNLPRLQKLSEELGAFIKEVHAYVRPEEAKSP